jgi:hypothetical protein
MGDDRNRGLYGKYNVERTDGEEAGACFVLAYEKDPYAWVALCEYVDECKDEYPQLAADLTEELERTRDAHGF